jgi:predicted nuclease of predicted toxin-antitoxin system
MRFLVDAQLPPALARWLRDHGQEAMHVGDLGLQGADDLTIAARAEADGAVLMSKDEDFVTLRLPDRFALVWLRCGNARNPVLMAWMAPRWTSLERMLDAGERFVEVR